MCTLKCVILLVECYKRAWEIAQNHRQTSPILLAIQWDLNIVSGMHFNCPFVQVMSPIEWHININAQWPVRSQRRRRSTWKNGQFTFYFVHIILITFFEKKKKTINNYSNDDHSKWVEAIKTVKKIQIFPYICNFCQIWRKLWFKKCFFPLKIWSTTVCWDEKYTGVTVFFF